MYREKKVDVNTSLRNLTQVATVCNELAKGGSYYRRRAFSTCIRWRS